MLTYYIRFITSHYRLVLILSVTLCLLIGSGVKQLGFKNDYRMFFSPDNPQLLAFDELQRRYTKSDNILFTVEAVDGEIFTTPVITAIKELTKRSWSLPFVSRVDSLTNFQKTRASGDELTIEDLVNKDLSAQTLESLKTVALAEPLIAGRLISPRGDVAGVNLTLQLPESDGGREVPKAAEAARILARDLLSEHPEIKIHITGGVMMNNAFPEASEADMKTLVPLMLCFIVAIIGIFLRSLWASISVFTVLSLSIFATLGAAGWVGIKLSPTSITAPTIILILVVAFTVHLIVTFLLSIDKGLTPEEAILASITTNLAPISISAATTTVGFLSMNSSDAPPFRDLGNLTAIGLILSYLLAFSLLPALLLLKRPHVHLSHTDRHVARFRRLSEFVIAKRVPLFTYGLISVITLSACIPLNELNDEFVKYFGKRMDFRQATDFTTERLTGIYYIDYSLRSKNSIASAEYLSELSSFADWYREQPEVMHVFSISDIIKTIHKTMNGEDAHLYQIPGSDELIAQYLLVYEMSLPYGLDLRDRITQDRSATRMTVTLRSISSREVLALEERAQRWLTQNSHILVPSQGTGPTVMFAHIGQRNILSMITGELTALGIIFSAMVLAFRSLRLGILAMIPNIVPPAMAFGLWGLLVGQVGLAVSVVAAMTLGIIVDDTIHFVWEYQRARRTMDREDSIRYAFSKVGTSLWIITTVFVGGFSCLSLSAFSVNASMGILTATVIVLAGFAELFLLPTLLLMPTAAERKGALLLKKA